MVRWGRAEQSRAETNNSNRHPLLCDGRSRVGELHLLLLPWGLIRPCPSALPPSLPSSPFLPSLFFPLYTLHPPLYPPGPFVPFVPFVRSFRWFVCGRKAETVGTRRRRRLEWSPPLPFPPPQTSGRRRAPAASPGLCSCSYTRAALELTSSFVPFGVVMATSPTLSSPLRFPSSSFHQHIATKRCTTHTHTQPLSARSLHSTLCKIPINKPTNC